ITPKRISSNPMIKTPTKIQCVLTTNEEPSYRNNDSIPTEEQSTPTRSPLPEPLTSRRRSKIFHSPVANVVGKARRVRVPSLNLSGTPKRAKVIESIEGLSEEGKIQNDLDSINSNAINLTPLNPRKRLSIFPSPSVEVSETSQQFVKMIANKDLNDDIRD
ncbi:4481_t:CDS:1, partial [Cetraspora pellucida]